MTYIIAVFFFVLLIYSPLVWALYRAEHFIPAAIVWAIAVLHALHVMGKADNK